MRKPARVSSIGVASLALALALAACGSSGSSSSGSTAAAGTSAPAATAAPGSSAAGGSSPGSVTIDTNFSGAGSGDLCTYAKQIEQSGILSSSAGLTKEQFAKFQEVYKNAEAKAPDEIKRDVQTVEKTIASLKSIYEKYNYDESKLSAAVATDPDVQKAVASLQNQDFQTAEGRVSAYLQQVCGITSS